MKKIFAFTLLFSLIEAVTFGQQIKKYQGELSVNSATLPLILSIETRDDTTIILMQSPMQSKEWFHITRQRLTADSILFTVKDMGIVFKGKYSQQKDTVCGLFKQGLFKQDLILTQTEKEYEILRPQEPKPPFPYRERNVCFSSEGTYYHFDGKLTLPEQKGKYPLIILVSGSGLQDFNSEIFGHKPFLLIADYFTRQGYAVFRYNDRGFGQTNPDSTITNATTLDYVQDLLAAIKILKQNFNDEIDTNKIILCGHSEGGLIVTAAAQKTDVAGLILLAGQGGNGLEVLLEQNEIILTKSGVAQYGIDFQLNAIKEIDRLIKRKKNDIPQKMTQWFDKQMKKYTPEQQKFLPNSTKAEQEMFIAAFTSSWLKTFLSLDNSVYLSKTKVPVLALNGSNDVQVIANEELPKIRKSLDKAGNKNYQIVCLKGLNHLFQPSQTGMPDEYSKIETTFDESALEAISTWLKSL